MTITRLLQGGLLILGLTLPAGADSLDVWQWRNPVPSGNSLNNVVYANGKFFACGAPGVIMTSTNGTAWAMETTRTAAAINSVAYGNALYVAVGASGVILTSPDGKVWSPQVSSAGTTNLAAVAFGQNQFVIAGGNNQGVILTSTNGTNWTTRFVGDSPLASVAFGNDVFVVSRSGSGGWIYTSGDGINWNPQPVSDNVMTFASLTFAFGRFYAVGAKMVNPVPIYRMHSSTDGTNWNLTTAPSVTGPGILFYGNNLLLSLGGTLNFLSSDGDTFMPLSTSGFINNASGGAAGSGKFVTVSGSIQVSADATNWSKIGPLGAGNNLADITYGNGVFVGVGGGNIGVFGVVNGGGVLVSTDGQSFAALNPPVNSSLARVNFANGLFHAVGAGGLILRSTNGLTWFQRNSATVENLYGIAAGNGLMVAVGNHGAIVTSPNGQAWTKRNAGTEYELYGVAYGQNIFVVVGYFGTVLTSPDGVNWTAQFNELTGRLRSVTYAAGLFVAVGDAGAVSTSPDGINWTTRNSGVTATLTGISHAGGQFVVAGDKEIITSADGITWTRRYPQVNTTLGGVAYLNHSFYAVGASGTIVQSALLDAIQLSGRRNPETSAFDLTVQSPPGSSYRIQARDNLLTGSWNDLASVTNSAAVLLYPDFSVTTNSLRTYRAVFN